MFDWLDDDDENEETDAEDGESEDEEDDDEDNSEAAIEATFREYRAKVRGSNDLGELRRFRRNLQNALADEKLDGLNAARARDLVELIDDRIATVRARQMTDGR